MPASRTEHRLRAAAAALAILLAGVSSSGAQAPLAASAGTVFEIIGACDGSAAVAMAPGRIDDILSWNDEGEATLRFDAARNTLPFANPPASDPASLQAQLRGGEPDQEADIEGAAWLGETLYLIGSHGRSSSGRLRPNRAQLVALTLRRDLTPPALAIAAGTRPYRDLARHLAEVPRLRAALMSETNRDAMLAPERAGLNIEGLAAGPDGTSLLIGLRNPFAPNGNAFVVRLRNAADLMATAGPAQLDPPLQIDLDNRGIRSLERVEGNADLPYLILGGPTGDGTDFMLFAWSGEGSAKPRPVAGFAEAIQGIPDFRPEALVVTQGGRRLMLLGDDGDRRIGGTGCKALPPEQRRFRALPIELRPAP